MAGLLDDVIYALLPSHVTSPRRIKVLLNAYATQTRVAEARNLAVTGMRRELALWVVLQAEFPSFAADLRIDPRLRHALLAHETGDGKRARMLARHRRLEQPDDDASADEWMSWTKRSHLADYLERTQHVPDVPFDLLFLEAAGSAIGFFAEEVAEVLDRADEATPSETLRQLTGIDSETRELAIWHLAEYSRRAISVGRDKVVSSMAGLIEQHDPSPVRYAEAALEAFRPYRPGDVHDDALVGQVRVTLESAPATLNAVLSDVDSRDVFANRALLVERLTFPSDLGDTTRAHLAAWWGPTMSAQLLRALVEKHEWRLISDAVEAQPLDLLQILALPFADTEAFEEAEETEASSATTDAIRVVTPDETEDADESDAADYGSNDPSWIDETIVEDILTELSPEASRALAAALATQAFAVDSTPTLAERLADAGSLGDEDLARLAAGIIAADTGADLDRWGPPAAGCQDVALIAIALERLVTRLLCGAAAAEVEAVLDLCVDLASRVGDEAVFDTITAQLQAEPWDEDPHGRAELGTTTVRHLESLDADRAAELANDEVAAALEPLAKGRLRPAQALALCDLLSIDAQKSVDDLLAATAEGPARSRRMEARLWLRRHSSHKLSRIQPSDVGRLIPDVDQDDKVATAARDQLVHEFFAKGPTERELSTFLTTGRRAFHNEMTAWLKATTPVPATNIWLQVVKSKYPDTTVRVLASARSLEPRRLAEYLASLAVNDDVDLRKRAVTLVRMFPTHRSDVWPAVQAVAVGINRKSTDETKAAIRLLVDYDPHPLTDEAKKVIRGAPRYAFIRKADKALRKRLGN
jgi:hypothetical protein